MKGSGVGRCLYPGPGPPNIRGRPAQKLPFHPVLALSLVFAFENASEVVLPLRAHTSRVTPDDINIMVWSKVNESSRANTELALFAG